jgi:alpha-glucosidase (family GH31 glycosyl hydrolase)
MPIVRPLFLADPAAPEAWNNWWTFQYGPDLVVSPVWEQGVREQQVWLPAGERWQNAWDTDEVFDGGQTVTVAAATHQLPLFIRVGSALSLGDLNGEWEDAQAAAAVRPDLATLERGVIDWFSAWSAAAE